MPSKERVKATKSKKSGLKQDMDSIHNNGVIQSSFQPTSNTYDAGPFSPQLSSRELSSDSNENLLQESIWTESCLQMQDMGNGNFQGSDIFHEILGMENDEEFAFLEATPPTCGNYFLIEPYVADLSHVPNELLAPLVNESDLCFSPMYDADLWSLSNSHDLYAGFFY
ncbi:hypothetical protein RJT34_28852 [Clitoria ternatea]|uniref:Uncharacterized protein n=1 Tax=Clitoria ternatea TaxID=43366 RepID=A0AAN9FBE5_CLITE